MMPSVEGGSIQSPSTWIAFVLGDVTLVIDAQQDTKARAETGLRSYFLKLLHDVRVILEHATTIRQGLGIERPYL
jgi:hypothetical protein